MSDDSYTVKEMIEEFRAENNRRFDKVDAAQAHTNGDVGILKLKYAELRGGMRVFVIIFSVIVIPLLVYVWNQALKQKSRLDTLSTYQQKYEIINTSTEK